MFIVEAIILLGLYGILVGFAAAVLTPFVWLLLRVAKGPTSAAAPAAVVIAVLASVVLFFWTYRPAAQFEDVFGFPPPPDVAELSASQFGLADRGEQEIAFMAGAQTVTRVIDARFGEGRIGRKSETQFSIESSGDGSTVYKRVYSERVGTEYETLEVSGEGRVSYSYESVH